MTKESELGKCTDTYLLSLLAAGITQDFDGVQVITIGLQTVFINAGLILSRRQGNAQQLLKLYRCSFEVLAPLHPHRVVSAIQGQ